MVQRYEQADEVLCSLLAKIGQQDKHALADLYKLTSGKLLSVAMRVVRVREYAEDVLQETYLSIWKSASDYQSSLSPPLAWMGLVARSRALDYLRKRANDPVPLLEQEGKDMYAEHADTNQDDPFDMALASEQAWALSQCLKKLEAPRRELLISAYYKDLSHQELASSSHLPLGTVKTWIRRSLDKLRQCLSQLN